MSTNLPDIEEARLRLTHVSGEISGLKTSIGYLNKKAASYFTLHDDTAAKLLRNVAGWLAQEIEVKDVELLKCRKTLEELEGAK